MVSRKRVHERMTTGGITRTELSMLRLMAQGADQYRMAEVLNLAASTVHGYRARLLKKLGASNSTHAVAIAYERGWLMGTLRSKPDSEAA